MKSFLSRWFRIETAAILLVVLVPVMLTVVLLLPGAPAKTTQISAETRAYNKIFDTHSVGSLGGKPVKFPNGINVGWVRYIGDPGDFETGPAVRNYKRPPITYRLPIEDVGFTFRVTDGTPLDKHTEMRHVYHADVAKYSHLGRPVPWANVIITNVPDPGKSLDFKGFTREIEQSDPVSVYSHYGRQRVSVHYTEEPSPIPGLLFYRLNNGINPLSKEPWGPKDDAREIYLRRDAEGTVDTYIECELAQSSSSPICDQRFYVKSMRTRVLIGYNRFYLPLWQKIESDLTRFMEGWVVPDDEIPPADPPATRQPASGS